MARRKKATPPSQSEARPAAEGTPGKLLFNSSADPGYQDWFQSVVRFGNLSPEEILRRVFAPQEEGQREEPIEVTGLRTITRIESPGTEDDKDNAACLASHGQVFLEQVEGVGMAAPTREALEDIRFGVLLADE